MPKNNYVEYSDVSVPGQIKSLEVEAHPNMTDSRILSFKEWLPFCAKIYNISDNYKDYLLIPVPTIISDIPNRNGVGFPLRELVSWNIEAGCQAYKTFIGKPVYLEHNNQNPVEARGVILDSVLRKVKGFGGGKLWKVVNLLAVDRTKDPMIAQGLASGQLNSFSMGAWVTGYECGYCGAPMGKCGHIREKTTDLYEIDGNLVFKRALGPTYFEVSIVKVPAYPYALSDVRISF